LTEIINHGLFKAIKTNSIHIGRTVFKILVLTNGLCYVLKNIVSPDYSSTFNNLISYSIV